MSEQQESKETRATVAVGGQGGADESRDVAAMAPDDVPEALAEELEVEREAQAEADELASSFVDDGNEANVLETHAVHTPQPHRRRWRLPFSESPRGLIGLIVGPLLALIVWMTPIADLSTSAHGLLAMMCLVCTWWICEPVPIPVTSLLVPVLAVLTGLCSASEAFAPFSNPMIYLFLGGFVLAKAMMLHGLDKRFAYWLLSRKWVGSSPTRIFLAIGAATALCSGWVSNTATAAMMVPLSVGLLDAIRQMFSRAGREVDMKTYKYATGLMLMTAYGASIGGVLTPIGTPPNLIMMGFLGTMADVHISFFQWMTWGAIAMIVYFVITAVLLQRMFPADVKEISGAQEFIGQPAAFLDFFVGHTGIVDARGDAGRTVKAVRKALCQLAGQFRIPVSGQGKRLCRNAGGGQGGSAYMGVAAGERRLNVLSRESETKGEGQPA